MVAQVIHDGLSLIAHGSATLQNHIGNDAFALDVMRLAHHGGLGHQRVRHQGRLDLHGAQAMTRHIQHIVDAAHDGEVAGLGIAH